MQTRLILSAFDLEAKRQWPPPCTVLMHILFCKRANLSKWPPPVHQVAPAVPRCACRAQLRPICVQQILCQESRTGSFDWWCSRRSIRQAVGSKESRFKNIFRKTKLPDWHGNQRLLSAKRGLTREETWMGTNALFEKHEHHKILGRLTKNWYVRSHVETKFIFQQVFAIFFSNTELSILPQKKRLLSHGQSLPSKRRCTFAENCHNWSRVRQPRKRWRNRI